MNDEIVLWSKIYRYQQSYLPISAQWHGCKGLFHAREARRPRSVIKQNGYKRAPRLYDQFIIEYNTAHTKEPLSWWPRPNDEQPPLAQQKAQRNACFLGGSSYILLSRS